MTFRTLALAAALLAVPSVALASQSVELKYDDLDLTTPQGLAQLDKRIDRAAKAVCTSRQVTTGTIRSSSVDQNCYHQARQRVQEQVAAATGHKLQG